MATDISLGTDLAVVDLAPVTHLAFTPGACRGKLLGSKRDAIRFAPDRPLVRLTRLPRADDLSTVPMKSWMTCRSTSTNVLMSSAFLRGKWDGSPGGRGAWGVVGLGLKRPADELTNSPSRSTI